MVSEFISVNEKFSGLSSLLIVAMLGWSMKSSLERFKTDSRILGFTKDSFSVAQGLDATFLLSSRKMSLRLLPLELLFGRSGFIFFQNRPGHDFVEAALVQKSFTALFFKAVTLFLCKPNFLLTIGHDVIPRGVKK